MKKLLTLLLAIVMVLSFAACGEKEEAVDATVLKDTSHEIWVAHGQYKLADGTENAWGGKSTELYEKSALKAISMKELKDISEELYNTLSKKEVKYLYTIDLIFGTNDANWSSRFMKDGKLYNANGSYCVKFAQCNADVDGDTKVYSEEQWISDPKTAYVEALTPKTIFYPTWQEEKDENGFAWDQNPVVIGGAGLYTCVVAQYKNASAAGQPGYGVGLVLKEAKDGIAYEEVKVWVPGDHTYGVIGVGGDWDNDVAMTKGEGNTWTATVTLTEGNEFKVRADGAWDNSWGSDGFNGANFKAETAGEYVVTITFNAAGEGTASFAAK